MSVEKVVKDINLIGEQMFDHTPVIRREVDRIYDNFERNERYKEFDGLIRASHALVEATDVSLESLVAEDELKKLNEEIKAVSKTITDISVPEFKKEHDEYLEAILKRSAEQVAVVEAEVQRQRNKLREEHARGRVGASQSSFDASVASEVDLS